MLIKINSALAGGNSVGAPPDGDKNDKQYEISNMRAKELSAPSQIPVIFDFLFKRLFLLKKRLRFNSF